LKMNKTEWKRLVNTVLEGVQEEGFKKGYMVAKLGLDWEKIPYNERKEVESEAILAQIKWEDNHNGTIL